MDTWQYPEHLIDLVDDGLISPQQLVRMVVSYFPAVDIQDMLECNGYMDDLPEDDHQPSEYTEWQDVYGGDDAFETCSYYGEE